MAEHGFDDGVGEELDLDSDEVGLPREHTTKSAIPGATGWPLAQGRGAGQSDDLAGGELDLDSFFDGQTDSTPVDVDPFAARVADRGGNVVDNAFFSGFEPALREEPAQVAEDEFQAELDLSMSHPSGLAAACDTQQDFADDIAPAADRNAAFFGGFEPVGYEEVPLGMMPLGDSSGTSAPGRDARPATMAGDDYTAERGAQDGFASVVDATTDPGGPSLDVDDVGIALGGSTTAVEAKAFSYGELAVDGPQAARDGPARDEGHVPLGGAGAPVPPAAVSFAAGPGVAETPQGPAVQPYLAFGELHVPESPMGDIDLSTDAPPRVYAPADPFPADGSTSAGSDDALGMPPAVTGMGAAQEMERGESGEAEMPAPERAALEADPQARRHTAVSALFDHITRAIQQQQQYGRETPHAARALQQAEAQLRATLLTNGPLVLTVTPFELCYDGKAIYGNGQEKEGPIYRIFSDGVRRVEVHPSIDTQSFAVLLDLLSGATKESDEGDAVTFLWHQQLTGLRYEAVDLFLEGMTVDESPAFQEQVDGLIRTAQLPLCQQPALDAAMQVRGRLTRETLDESAANRATLLARAVSFERGGAEDGLTCRGAEVSVDLWRRAIAILARMMTSEDGGQPGSFGSVFVGIIERMMQEGRWEMVKAACQALNQLATAAGTAARSTGAEEALRSLCADNRLLTLHAVLARCHAEQIEALRPLLEILPPQADMQLRELASRVPEGPAQDAILSILEGRGVDLTGSLKERLHSADPARVVETIAQLRAIGTEQAMSAIAAVLNSNHATVREAVLQALDASVSEQMVPHLLGSLQMNSASLRELALKHLLRFKTRQFSGRLVKLAKGEAIDDWTAQDRVRLYAILIVWGGDEANELVVRTVTAKNPLRRPRIDRARDEVLQALQTVRSVRSLKLLEACLRERVSKPLEGAIRQAMSVQPREKTR